MKKYFLALSLLVGVISFGKGKNVSDTTRPLVNNDSVFRKVEVEASFTSGGEAWRRYLERNCNAEIPSLNHAPSGAYTVIVQFIVDKNGDISDVKPLTNHGFGMEDEVVRLISKGPKWQPAIMNGMPVKAYRKQPLTFQVISDFELSTYTITVGKSNSVEITVDRYNIKAEDIEVTLSYGTITHDSENRYIIMVDKPGRILLTVKSKAKKKKDEYDYGTVAIEAK
jgi:hypothetical protein